MFQSYVTFDGIINNQVTRCQWTLGISSNKHTLLPNDAVLLQMKNLRHLSDQNLNFGGVQRVTTENALKDLKDIYLKCSKRYLSYWNQIFWN